MTFQPRSPGRSGDGPDRLARGGALTPDELAVAALVSRLPAAAPDDLSVERVWRRVTAPAVPLTRPPSVWIPVGVLGALLAVALTGQLFWRRTPAVELTLSSGGVFSSKLGEDWRAGQSGEALAESERVRTDATGRAVLRLRGVAAILLGEETDVGLERLDHGTFVRLSRGTFTARVAKRKPDEPFVVQTERYRVRVVGTLFTVEEGPGDHTAVSVREGVVEVSDGLGRVDRVVAGQRWTSETAEARTPDRTPDAVRNLLEDGLHERPMADLAGDFVAAMERPRPASAAPVAPRVEAPIAPAAAPQVRRRVQPAQPIRPTGPVENAAALAPSIPETVVTGPAPVAAPPVAVASDSRAPDFGRAGASRNPAGQSAASGRSGGGSTTVAGSTRGGARDALLCAGPSAGDQGGFAGSRR